MRFKFKLFTKSCLTNLLESSVHELEFALVELGQLDQIVERLRLEPDRLRVELIEFAVCLVCMF